MNFFDCVKAFWLESDDAVKAWRGETDLLIKPKVYRFIMNKKYLLIDDAQCYGVISFFHKPVRLLPSEFSETMVRHGLSNLDKINRWRSGNKTVFGYEFFFVEKFDKPVKITISSVVDDFVAIESIVTK